MVDRSRPRPRTAPLAAFVAFVVALTSTGCSVMSVTPARSMGSPTVNLQCTKTQGAPRGDLVLAVLGGAITALGLTAHDETFEGKSVGRTGFVTLALVPTLVFAGSAVYGFNQTSECARLSKKTAHDDDAE